MALKKITAYECEHCGRLFKTDKNYHEIECKHDPSGRSCTTCIFNCEKKSKQGTNIVYCPRADELFEYPHEKYCHSYKRDPLTIKEGE